jgi:hypothetical protein
MKLTDENQDDMDCPPIKRQIDSDANESSS